MLKFSHSNLKIMPKKKVIITESQFQILVQQLICESEMNNSPSKLKLSKHAK